MMLRFIVRLSLPLMMLFASLSAVSYALGTTQPLAPMLEGFRQGCENQPHPCWNGIVLGETNLKSATHILNELGYQAGLVGPTDYALRYTSDSRSPGCVELYFDRQSIQVISIVLSCTDMHTGDLTALLGNPTFQAWYTQYSVEWIYDQIILRLAGAWSESPFDNVGTVRLVQTLGRATPGGSVRPWHGFLPRWKYCQLEDIYQGCPS